MDCLRVTRSVLAWALCAGMLLSGEPCGVWGQEQSVKPGINDSFESPVVGEWVERFEKEGREVYDQREQLVALCEITPGQTIADVGAGTGLFTRLFASATGPDGKVWAVDISEEFLENIAKRAQADQQANIVTLQCTVDDATLAPNSVDVVYICDTYHHFEFPLKTMASIHKALKPGGRVVVVDFHRVPGTSSDWVMGHVRAGKEVVQTEIESVGFRLLKQDTDLLKENYVLVFVKG